MKYYDWCVGKMAAGPDGYKGWTLPDGCREYSVVIPE